MNRFGAAIAGLWLSAALLAAPAIAQARPSSAAGYCCRVAAGTEVQVELAQPLSTKVQQSGDSFALRLAQPLIVGGMIVLPAGTPGVGEVVQSEKAGMGGKGGKLVLSASYLRRRGGRIPLQGLQLSTAGHDNSAAAQAAGLPGLVFAPLGFIGLAVKGGDVLLPAGSTAAAKIAVDLDLPPIARASRHDMALAAASSSQAVASDDEGSIIIPPPPPGEGQVVFFRRKTPLGVAQWFKVRENGMALGKLTNGAYFIQVTDPGRHTYTASEEPELKDHLTLQVDGGETYFVQGELTKGLVLGAADLSPSDRVTFDQASKDLKPAPSPNDDANSSAPSAGPSASDSAGSAAGSAQGR